MMTFMPGCIFVERVGHGAPGHAAGQAHIGDEQVDGAGIFSDQFQGARAGLGGEDVVTAAFEVEAVELQQQHFVFHHEDGGGLREWF